MLARFLGVQYKTAICSLSRVLIARAPLPPIEPVPHRKNLDVISSCQAEWPTGPAMSASCRSPPTARKEFCELEQGQADWYVDTELKKAQVTYRLLIRPTID
jgi:hypothetical protein